MKVVVTGGTGFVGQPLVRRLLEAGHEVTVYTRSFDRARPLLPVRCGVAAWDPAAGTIDAGALRGAGAVVHLAGEGVADARWTAERKRAIRDSRVASTTMLVEALAALPPGERPGTLVAASAIGYYGDRGDEELDEKSSTGGGFLADVCVDWERASLAAETHGVRTAVIRIGVVLGRGGGALARILPPFRMGGGGRIGSGRQWMSWIHRDDLVGMFLFALESPAARGALNGVAPEPVTNATFTRTLGEVLHRPTIVPVPATALRLALGEMSTVLLASQRVRPRAAGGLGFAFRHPELRGALAEICRDHHTELEREQWIGRDPEEVFRFFSDARNLEAITPPFMRFHVLGTSTPELTHDTRIDYRLRIRRVPVRWQSLIDVWEPPRRFVDVQTKGPYRSWHHTHEFEPYEGGTVIRDRVRYELPLGVLGEVVAGGMVARDVDAIFAYRRAKIEEIFGPKE